MGKGFLRSLGLVAALWAGVASAEAVTTVKVGDAELQVPVEDGYLAASVSAPTLYSMSQAGLPVTHRLVEGFMSRADLKRVLIGQRPEQVFYQVQVMRDAEQVELSEQEWQQARPQIAQSMGAVDMQALADSMQRGASERMSETAGLDVEVSFGKVGAPTLYGDDPNSLRFVMLLPINGQVAGQQHAVTLECAGAVARVGGKLLFLFAYRDHTGGADAATVRTALDRFVDRTVALNSTVAGQAEGVAK
ncbi:hypothetical protein ACFFGH_02295 [Lysobacter korlensis]|uniref:Uncharacterized protein n=1 Tax=Lysobacter korlensis TaxID=553636 RepID=A0ABV6RI76_9GAMM